MRGRINQLSFSNPICQNSNFQFQCSCCWINQQVESWSVVWGGSWCWCWCYSNSISSKLCRRLCGGEEKPTTSFIALPPTASLSIYKMQICNFLLLRNTFTWLHIFTFAFSPHFQMRPLGWGFKWCFVAGRRVMQAEKDPEGEKPSWTSLKDWHDQVFKSKSILEAEVWNI